MTNRWILVLVVFLVPSTASAQNLVLCPNKATKGCPEQIENVRKILSDLPPFPADWSFGLLDPDEFSALRRDFRVKAEGNAISIPQIRRTYLRRPLVRFDWQEMKLTLAHEYAHIGLGIKGEREANVAAKRLVFPKPNKQRQEPAQR